MVIVTIILVIITTMIVMVRGVKSVFTFAATALAAAASPSWTKNEPESQFFLNCVSVVDTSIYEFNHALEFVSS